ncbi:ComEC/Rec2 family competence protein [Flavobacterium dauae]|uniref:ComEC/Rec2 family competence protein n=1 Tax=Flavobacterium dauae TaxID=1563479 RepID=UPI00101D2679|nr:ComEC/Rec2 family competence protein [Flavobacterium dauae]WLD24213.1 ComEC/Rec2 family competence protein [Flavobacterium dauae]
MKKVMKYPIYPIAFSYVSGIFCGFYFKLPDIVMLLVAVLSFIALLFLYILQRNNGFNNKLNVFTILAVFIAFSSLGFLSYNFNNKLVIVDNLNEKEFTIKVTDVLKSNAYSHRMYADLVSAKEQPKVLVSFSNKTNVPKVGNVYKLVGTIKKVPKPRNLYDFNYSEYLRLKHIHYQIISYNQPFKITEEKSFQSIIISGRGYLTAQFFKLGYSEETQGFIQALLFGIKTNLNDEIQQQFKDFGILHVLAVSGMHVVLLFSTISYVLRKLRVSKNVITVILIIFLLIFSLMAGFSGSVVRASLMCLMTIIGTLTGRRIHTINLLVGSMLLILLFDPNYLFDVGFQLSYLAVFAIVFCYPVVQHYFTFKNWILNYFGQLVGVSLVAQLGVLPLSIYYFKQIPLLFLIGNIIAIPITSFLLVVWFLQMLLSLISVEVFSFFTPFLSWISTFCFDTLSRLSDYFSVKTIDFHFGILQTILALLMIFTMFWFFQKKQLYKVYVFLSIVVLFQLITLKNVIENKSKEEIVVMNDVDKVVIINRVGNRINQIGNADEFTLHSLRNYELHTNSKVATIDSLQNSFVLKDKKWLIIDSLEVYPKQQFDYVVLYQNPKVNLDRLMIDVQPKIILLHNGNYQYLIDEYSEYFKKRKIPYYDMKSKGSFVIDYN